MRPRPAPHSAGAGRRRAQVRPGTRAGSPRAPAVRSPRAAPPPGGERPAQRHPRVGGGEPRAEPRPAPPPSPLRASLSGPRAASTHSHRRLPAAGGDRVRTLPRRVVPVSARARSQEPGRLYGSAPSPQPSGTRPPRTPAARSPSFGFGLGSSQLSARVSHARPTAPGAAASQRTGTVPALRRGRRPWHWTRHTWPWGRSGGAGPARPRGRSPPRRDPSRSPPGAGASGARASDRSARDSQGLEGARGAGTHSGKGSARCCPGASPRSRFLPDPPWQAQAKGTWEERSRRDRAGNGASGAAGKGLSTVLVSLRFRGTRRWRGLEEAPERGCMGTCFPGMPGRLGAGG